MGAACDHAEPEQKYPTGFGMFVRHHHKPHFLQTCADLMGLPTTSGGLELPGPREKSTTVPSELAHEDIKPGESPLKDSCHPKPLMAPGSYQERNKLPTLIVCRSLCVQEA